MMRVGRREGRKGGGEGRAWRVYIIGEGAVRMGEREGGKEGRKGEAEAWSRRTYLEDGLHGAVWRALDLLLPAIPEDVQGHAGGGGGRVGWVVVRWCVRTRL